MPQALLLANGPRHSFTSHSFTSHSFTSYISPVQRKA